MDDSLAERKPAKSPESLIARQSTTTIPVRAETWHDEPGVTQARPLPARTEAGLDGPGPSQNCLNTGRPAPLADWPGHTPDQRNRVVLTGGAAQPPNNRTISPDHPLGGGFEDTRPPQKLSPGAAQVVTPPIRKWYGPTWTPHLDRNDQFNEYIRNVEYFRTRISEY